MQLNLSKEQTRELVTLSLSKNSFDMNTKAKVCIVLDGSGSMSNLYANGTVQALVDRALAVGYKFDDDGSIDIFDFSSEGEHRMLEQASQDDHGSYMKGKRMLGGSTSYAGVIDRVKDFYYKTTTKGGFLGFGSKKSAPEGRDGFGDTYPVYCIFITDGESWTPTTDSVAVKEALSHKDMFIQFVGVGNEHFTELKKYANAYSNAAFFDVSSLSSISDDDFMNGILNQKVKKTLNT